MRCYGSRLPLCPYVRERTVHHNHRNGTSIEMAITPQKNKIITETKHRYLMHNAIFTLNLT